MMKRFLFCSTIIFFAVWGCNTNPKPAVSPDSYGTIVEKLPDIPETKEPMPHPDYVELRHMK